MPRRFWPLTAPAVRLVGQSAEPYRVPMTVVRTIETRTRTVRRLVTAARVRFALLAVLACLAFCAVGLGSRGATLGELTSAIASGRVTEVTLVGGRPPGATGSGTLTVLWREGSVHRVTTVVELSDEAQSATVGSSAEQAVGDVRSRLVAAAPDGSLGIVTGEPPVPTGPVVAGWTLPGWMGPALLLLWGATLMLMMFGPEPWWATRWGWAWWLFGPIAVLGVPLYLLVSGPPPGVKQAGVKQAGVDQTGVDQTNGVGWRLTGPSTFAFAVVVGGLQWLS